jgi:hypothetical protein
MAASAQDCTTRISFLTRRLKQILKQALVGLSPVLPGRKDVAILADPAVPPTTLKILHRAAKTFSGTDGIKFHVLSLQLSTIALRALYLRYGGLLVTGLYRDITNLLPIRLLPIAAVDPLLDPTAMWGWHNVIGALSPFTSARLRESRTTFEVLIRGLVSVGYRKCYIFGTGPSLEKAAEIDFSDGYRIICNTICKDRELVRKLQPHILVAGDALYHFSDTKHAQAFLADLELRMEEFGFAFCYPALFDAFVRNRMARFKDRLIPLPMGGELDLTVDMTQTFAVPNIGNVLGHLLLPIACQLAKEIWMLGFDGRKPGDKLFWTNSTEHSYPDLIEEMSLEYPAFYHHLVPSHKPTAYVESVHGDALDQAMTVAEQNGWSFTLLSPSTSPALAKRRVVYRGLQSAI